MSDGTTSNARRLDTDQGSYIMRKLSGRPQAENEFRISELLKHQGVCPEILRTEAGAGWMQSEDGIYNVQRYIEPLPAKDSNKRDYHELGEKAGLLHRNLKNIELSPQPDRFDLERTGRSFLNKGIGGGQKDLIERIERDVQVCLTETLTGRDIQYIHGDLGSWNLVFGKDGVRIIDFGELRFGDPHFDLAALLTSTLDVSDEQAEEHLSSFIQGYSRYTDRYEPYRLAFHIRLWNVRGVAALLNQVGWNEKSAQYARTMLDQHEAFTELLIDEHKNLSKKE